MFIESITRWYSLQWNAPNEKCMYTSGYHNIPACILGRNLKFTKNQATIFTPPLHFIFKPSIDVNI